MYQNLGISYVCPGPYKIIPNGAQATLGPDATSPCLALVNQLVIKGFIQSLEIQIYTQTADKPYIFCLGADFSFWLCAFSYTGCFFLTGKKYGKPRLGESTLT